ncbi:hypothetical protein [Streptomyces sp. NPDC089919]|uniref:hypothetical protein n=1 Tax=Streptomyces sp. NPDC089919 TaxID=3155188 RepID=UPI0034219675
MPPLPPGWPAARPQVAAVVPEPEREPDWLDALYAYPDLAPAEPVVAEPAPEPEAAAEAEAEPGEWLRPAEGYWPSMPAAPSLPERPALSNESKQLLENAAAVAGGWWIGLEPLYAGWINDCGRNSISGALVLGGVLCLGTAAVWDRRTRHWHPVIRWIARIPLASAVTALALYAPATPFHH